jgi:hypothetical protein
MLMVTLNQTKEATIEMPVCEAILELRYEAEKALINKKRNDIMLAQSKGGK